MFDEADGLCGLVKHVFCDLSNRYSCICLDLFRFYCSKHITYQPYWDFQIFIRTLGTRLGA